MRSIRQNIAEARKVYDLFWDSYLAGDVDAFALTLDDKFEMIGTSEKEVCHSKEEGIEFFKGQIDELIGKVEMRYRHITEVPLSGPVLINEACDIYTLSDSEWNFYSKIRISTLLHQTSAGWKVVHQHGSLPDMRVQEGETLAIDKISKENLELRDAVKRRTAELEKKNRELEIEAALERVRAKSMAMHDSRDLHEIVTLVYEQLEHIGLFMNSVLLHELVYDSKEQHFWVAANGQVYPEQTVIPITRNAMFSRFEEARKNGESFFTQSLSKRQKDNFFDHYFKQSNHSDVPQERKDYIYSCKGLNRSTALHKNTALTIGRYDNIPYSVEENEVLRRFAQVFEQSYQRYLDLKKAEEQTREAQIEAALERVRARSMGMHKSNDLIDVVREIGNGIHELGIQLHYSQIYTDYTQDTKTGLNIWVDVEGRDYLEKFQLPYIDHSITLNYYNALNEGLDHFSDRYSKAEKDSYFKLLFKYSDLKRIPKKRKELILNASGWTRFTVILNEATLNFGRYTLDEFTNEEHEIFIRFAKVFGQAYTRFLDLKKAEEQAREAQIEAALERVRSRSLAMHKTNELQDVVRVVAEELKNTGVILDTGGAVICTYFQDSKDVIHWTATEDPAHPSVPYFLPYFENELFDEAWESKSRGDDYLAKVFSYDVKNAFFSHAFEHSDYRQLPDEYKKIILESKSHGLAWAWAENSAIMIPSIQGDLPSEEEMKILIRFAKVFEQSFIRFLDLQKAEEQTRETEIQLSLERVRARSMAMQKSDELHDVLSVLFDQFYLLGIEPVNVFLSLFSREDKTLTYRATGTGGSRTQGQQVVSLDSMEVWQELFEKWKNDNSDSVEVIYYEKEIMPILFELLDETFSSMPEDERMNIDDFPKGGYTMHGYTPFGYIGFNHTRPPTEEEKEILTKFASEFSRVYQRFLDIERAEAQARESEIQLALERVRARTMAMHKSEELGEVAAVLFEQISLLTNKPERFQIAIAREDEKAFDIWVTDQEGDKVSKQFSFNSDRSPVVAEVFKAWQKKEETLIQDLHGKKLNNWIRYFSEEAGLPLMEDHIKEHRYINSVFFSHGCIGITTNEPIETGTLQLLQRFTKVFQQTYIRFLDLQKAEAQARESQIEAALERVRAKAMAMHNTGDLANANSVVFDELNSLGISPLRSGIGLIDAETRQGSMYATVKSDLGNNLLLIGQITLAGHHILESIYDHWINKQLYNVELNGQELKQYYEIILASYGDLPKPEFSKKETQHGYFIPFKHGSFYAWTREPFNDVALQTIQRFVSVINLTYNRYFDLQKAEEQAQEARIETALEKVRSRTMAMQSSEELPEVANIMYLEIQELGIPAWSCGYNISAEDKLSATCWMSSEGILQKPFKLRLFGEASYDEMGEFLRNDQETMLVQELGGKAIQDHYEYMRSFPDLKPTFDNIIDEGLSLPEYQINHLCKFTSGFLLFITYEHVPDSHEIFRRFTNVFDQTYTRFSDLRKAEAQARESDIEAALERVRATSMAMQKTENISEVVTVLFKQLKKLNISFVQSWISVFHLEDDYFDIWFSPVDDVYDDVQYFKMPSALFENTSIKSWREGHAFSYITFKDRAEVLALVQACDAATNSNYFTHIQKHLQSPRLEFLDANFKYGVVSITDENKPSDEDEEVMLRFAKVFEQTYTRFLDLEKAESLALETQRQSSLDRVRAEIASMRSSEDLQQITPLIWNELKILNIPFIRCGVFIIDEEDQISHTYLSTPQGESIAVLHLPLEGIPLTEKVYSSWSDQQFYSEHWNETDFENWIDNLIKNGFITSKENYKAGSVLDSLDLHFLPFEQGMLYIGNTEPLSEEDIKLGQSLANAFSVAYNRYEDFSKLEQAKERVEHALRSLESAQEQLVQQEKLASLGQLTAGIAHEIKNPLNFINNFSDLSIELVDELRDEFASIAAIHELQNQDINDILDDLQANLKTIYKHGSRTDMIVKSMLEHSRGGTGEMEPNNINELLKEYGNLSYHGMRAGKDPILVKMEYDLDESIKEIPVVAEDFSRVIVNLCYNGFDAMREKMTGEQRPNTNKGYEPKLTFRTYSKANNVFIEIEDNGPGIPEEIKDKIMQPFFTTKKGTDGTGLGLSITNDIIKAHGGTMDIHSKPGQSVFTIKLNG